MKIALKLAMALAIAMGLNACSDKKQDEPQQPAANEVSGTYTGIMAATAMGTDLTFENVEMRIVAADDSHVNITVASFGNPPMTLPEINIRNLTVTGSEGNYALAETQFSSTSPDGKKYSGTIRGTYNGSLVLNMELSYGAMPMPLACRYEGTKKI